MRGVCRPISDYTRGVLLLCISHGVAYVFLLRTVDVEKNTVLFLLTGEFFDDEDLRVSFAVAPDETSPTAHCDCVVKILGIHG